MRTKHYHAMNGSIGCLPDSNEIFTSCQAAIEYLVELFNETRGLKSQLTKYDICYSDKYHPLLGADYCEVAECHDLACLNQDT